MTSLDNDELLVTRLKNGDQEAQEDLLTKYGTVLLRFIIFVLRADEQEAEDIAVETLYKAIERIDSFEFRQSSPNGFRNWLFQIAKNHFYDQRRLEYELQPVDEETLIISPIVDTEGISEQIRAVREAVDTLPERQRMTLILHFNGWHLNEIADHYDVKPGTVRQWKARGLTALTKILEVHPALQSILHGTNPRIGELK